MNRAAFRTGHLNWMTVDNGASRGLILLHSLGTALGMWQPQLEAFSAQRRVVLLDLPGHGESKVNPGDYRLEDLGADVLEVADRAGLDRFDVAGVSIGGLIGLWLAVNAPERVLSLIAANTAARLGNEQLWAGRIEAVSAEGMEGIRAQVTSRFLASDFEQRDPDTYSKVQEMFRSTDPVGYIGCCAALRDADLTNSVSEITCPTLFVGGDEDVATPPSQSEWLHQAIAGSRLAIIPGAAHLTSLDRPEAFNQAALGALTEWG